MTTTTQPAPTPGPARTPLAQLDHDEQQRIVQRVLSDADGRVASTLDIAAFNSSI